MQPNRARMQVSFGNLFWGMQFRTCRKFWTSTDFSLVESPKFSTNTKATPPLLRLRNCLSQNLLEKYCHSERSEESLFSSLRNFAKQSCGNLEKIIAHKVRTLIKFLLLFAFAKRRVPYASSLRDSAIRRIEAIQTK